MAHDLIQTVLKHEVLKQRHTSASRRSSGEQIRHGTSASSLLLSPTEAERNRGTNSFRGYSVPSADVTKAMEICARCDEMDKCESILKKIDNLGYAVDPALHSTLYSMVLKGYAKTGNTTAVVRLLSHMRASGMKLR